MRVRLIYDWMGGFGKSSRRFWNHLRAGGVDVRCYNPPRLDSPFGWLSRDHRKMLAVDGRVGFITGLCVGRMWAGVPEKKIDPWWCGTIAVESKVGQGTTFKILLPVDSQRPGVNDEAGRIATQNVAT